MQGGGPGPPRRPPGPPPQPPNGGNITPPPSISGVRRPAGPPPASAPIVHLKPPPMTSSSSPPAMANSASNSPQRPSVLNSRAIEPPKTLLSMSPPRGPPRTSSPLMDSKQKDSTLLGAAPPKDPVDSAPRPAKKAGAIPMFQSRVPEDSKAVAESKEMTRKPPAPLKPSTGLPQNMSPPPTEALLVGRSLPLSRSPPRLNPEEENNAARKRPPPPLEVDPLKRQLKGLGTLNMDSFKIKKFEESSDEEDEKSSRTDAPSSPIPMSKRGGWGIEPSGKVSPLFEGSNEASLIEDETSSLRSKQPSPLSLNLADDDGPADAAEVEDFVAGAREEGRAVLGMRRKESRLRDTGTPTKVTRAVRPFTPDAERPFTPLELPKTGKGPLVVTTLATAVAPGGHKLATLNLRPGRLTVRLLDCSNLLPLKGFKSKGTVDPFVKLRLGASEVFESKKSAVVRKAGDNPKFNRELISFDVVDPLE